MTPGHRLKSGHLCHSFLLQRHHGVHGLEGVEGSPPLGPGAGLGAEDEAGKQGQCESDFHHDDIVLVECL